MRLGSPFLINILILESIESYPLCRDVTVFFIIAYPSCVSISWVAIASISLVILCWISARLIFVLSSRASSTSFPLVF